MQSCEYSKKKLFVAVKRELKLENRINGLEIKAEPDVHRTDEYPTTLQEYFQRPNAQMFMLQVSTN